LFTPAERDGSAPVVVVNERLASEMFPGQSAVGQYLPVSQEAKIRIVGVVKDSWQAKYDQQVVAEMYLPYEQSMRWAFASSIVIRTDRDRSITAEALQQAIWAVDPNQPITRIEGMDEILSDAIWRPRFSAWAFSLLGLIALLEQLERVLPGATWTAAGLGRDPLTVYEWSLELGGHCRTGLEDNLKFDKDRLASSNAELVQRVADLAGKFGRSVATPAEARRILGLRAA
jgi:hypothetical protein